MASSGSAVPKPSYQTQSPSPFTSKVTTTDSNAIYHEVSPKFVLIGRVCGVLAALMSLIAFICTLVKGGENHNLYLLTTNLVISGFVGLVIAWWYRKGDLSPDKYWFVYMVCAVIIFQCITTDIYAFHAPNVKPTPSPTPSIRTSTWVTQANISFPKNKSLAVPFTMPTILEAAVNP